MRYLQWQPVVSQRPPRVNPATWMLNELEAEKQRVSEIVSGRLYPAPGRKGMDVSGFGSIAEAELLRVQSRSPLLHEAFAQSPLHQSLLNEIAASRSSSMAP